MLGRTRDVISRAAPHATGFSLQPDRLRSPEYAKFWIFKIGPVLAEIWPILWSKVNSYYFVGVHVFIRAIPLKYVGGGRPPPTLKKEGGIGQSKINMSCLLQSYLKLRNICVFVRYLLGRLWVYMLCFSINVWTIESAGAPHWQGASIYKWGYWGHSWKLWEVEKLESHSLHGLWVLLLFYCYTHNFDQNFLAYRWHG